MHAEGREGSSEGAKLMATIGNYRITRQIAEGGFGKIYQAEHALLGSEALACLKQNIELSKFAYDLLLGEARILWRLNEHHSIPQAKDFIQLGKHEGVLVMSYIEGDTLDSVVAKNSRLHPEDASWIMERLLGALYYAHYNGIIHADIKPQNIIIEPRKRDIKVIDWGLAAVNPTSATKLNGYTPAYVAPEIVLGKPPIPETDLYGAGIVLLYALGGNAEKKTLPADTPGELADFCNSLVLYDPGRRPNWDKGNPIEKLSDIRMRVFGRRHVA